MIIVSTKQVKIAHNVIISKTGGRKDIRDEGLLESAIMSPFQLDCKYKTVEEKIARISYNIIKNHPFIDGNKRVGAHVMLLLLIANGIGICYRHDELYNIIMNIANKGTYEDLLDWIKLHE